MKKVVLSVLVIIVASCLVFASPQEDLFSACLKMDLAGVEIAVGNGADVKAINSVTGQNALASAFFSPAITAYLLEQGCDPNGGNYPALVSASSVASLEVMKLLLDNGADPNLTGMNESPLLKVVQMTNCPEAAEMLISKGADINTTGGGYANLIGVYASYGLPSDERKEAMIKYGDLLKGFGLAVPDWYYDPPKNLTVPPAEMLKVLVKNGLDINKRGANIFDPKKPGEPPLFIAMNVGKQEIIMSLLNNGADYNDTYLPINPRLPLFAVEGEYTPLMYACTLGYKDMVEWLAAKTDLDNPSISGKIITDKKMIINISGISAIYLAIMSGDLEMVKMIAESSMDWEDFVFKALPGQKFDSSYGSKPPAYQFIHTKKSKLKYTPSLYAEFSELPEIAEYLRSEGL